MAVKLKGVSVNYAIVLISGLVLVIAAILIFLLILKSVFGNFDIKDTLPTLENINYVFVKKQANIAILYSKYTETTLPEGSTWVADNVSTWERYAKFNKLYYAVIQDDDIELGEHFKYDLIILPGSLSISDLQVIQLKKYIDRGGSILSTMGTATYSTDTKWRGWDFCKEVFGLKFTKEIEPTEVYKIHTLRGNLPLTAGIPTGFTLKIATWDRPIYMETYEPRAIAASFWYDFRKEAGLVRESIEKSTGIAYGTYGQGRFIWYGFELNSVLGGREDYLNFEKLIKNSINWLTYQPIAFIRDWPPPYEAATILIPQLSEKPENARNLMELVKSTQYPATFFLDLSRAEQSPNLIKQISRYGEIGAIADIGYIESPQDTVNKLFALDIQTTNISDIKSKVENITGSKITGLMPLYGYYDDNTLQAVAAGGIDYIVTDSLTDRSVPKVIVRNDQNILQITKTARDDLEVVREYGLTDTQFQLFTYKEDIDRILYEGGLYVFKVHSDYQMRPEFVKVVDDVMKYAKKQKMWVTSIKDLKQWWMRRGRVELQYSISSKVRMEVEVTNLSEEPIDNFFIEVILNKKVANLNITSDLVNTILPELLFNKETNELKLLVKNLAGGESRSYFLDYENVLF